jgi:hypothetical protein
VNNPPSIGGATAIGNSRSRKRVSRPSSSVEAYGRVPCWLSRCFCRRAAGRGRCRAHHRQGEKGRFAEDSPLEGDGFEPSVPRQKDLCKRSPPIASTGGADRRENGENADLAPSLRHRKLVEQLDGFRDAAGENSGCGVALQVLGCLPVRSSGPFIGEFSRKTWAGSTVPVWSDKVAPPPPARMRKRGGFSSKPAIADLPQRSRRRLS